MATSIPFSTGGLSGEFTALVGTVIATERHTTASVSGGGYNTSVNGQVFGKTNITTDITVIREIWLRDAEGVEHYRRIKLDLPVRVGQHFAFIGYEGKIRTGQRHVTYEMGISNLSTNKYLEINSTKFLAKTMAYGFSENFSPNATVGWGVSIFLCLFYGLGVLGLFWLGPMYKKDRAVKLAKDEVIRATIEDKFQEMLALVNAESARLAPASETPTGSRLRSGTAD